ncbi:MAG: hypothetical protein E7589_07985, partial [Ruminococcaceae bacterium]|nr:hypothetical protein [Oscillospiraceae bacterium]
MKKKEWNEGLNNLEPDIVEKYVNQKGRLASRKKQKGIWIRFGAVAACFAVIVSAVIIVPMLHGDDTGIILPPDTTDGGGELKNPDTTDNALESESITEGDTTSGTSTGNNIIQLSSKFITEVYGNTEGILVNSIDGDQILPANKEIY